MEYKERLAQFEAILCTRNLAQDPIIDLYKFRHLCFRGIPDKHGIRQISWKVLLGYLPPDKRKWSRVLAEQRSTYYSFVRDLLVDPSEEGLKDPIPSEDHPLNPAPNSKWAEYLADNIILDQIDKDVRRTLPDFAFFQQPVPHSSLSPLSPRLAAQEINNMSNPRSPSIFEALDTGNDDDVSISNFSDSTDAEVASLDVQLFSIIDSKPTQIDAISVTQNAVAPIPTRRSIFRRVQHLPGIRRTPSPASSHMSDVSHDYDDEVDLHWEAIERILFIFAKLNPGVGYVQGMNEILGPIYYTMANDSDKEGKAHAEADSFFIFTLLMARIRDYFVRSLDTDSATGIGHSIKKMNRRLKTFEPELWADLERKSLYPTYYSFRWLTVLFTQEFALPDVIRLWDSILSDNDDEESTIGFEFLLDFACAMLICVKQELLRGSFSDNIKLLQNYPIQDPAIVLLKAYSLRENRLIAKMNGEDVDAFSEYEDFDYYQSNSDYEPSMIAPSSRDVKVRGLTIFKKVQEAVNGKGSSNDASNRNMFSSVFNNNYINGFAIRFPNVWKRNIAISNS